MKRTRPRRMPIWPFVLAALLVASVLAERVQAATAWPGGQLTEQHPRVILLPPGRAIAFERTFYQE